MDPGVINKPLDLHTEDIDGCKGCQWPMTSGEGPPCRHESTLWLLLSPGRGRIDSSLLLHLPDGDYRRLDSSYLDDRVHQRFIRRVTS